MNSSLLCMNENASLLFVYICIWFARRNRDHRYENFKLNWKKKLRIIAVRRIHRIKLQIYNEKYLLHLNWCCVWVSLVPNQRWKYIDKSYSNILRENHLYATLNCNRESNTAKQTTTKKYCVRNNMIIPLTLYLWISLQDL